MNVHNPLSRSVLLSGGLLALLIVRSGFAWRGIEPQAERDAALLAALHAGDTENVQALLDRGANANARDSGGQYAISLAGESPVIATINAMSVRGGCVTIEKHQGYAPIVTTLVRHGARINVRNRAHITPLQQAQSFDEAEVVHLLQQNAPKQAGTAAYKNMAKEDAAIYALLLASQLPQQPHAYIMERETVPPAHTAYLLTSASDKNSASSDVELQQAFQDFRQRAPASQVLAGIATPHSLRYVPTAKLNAIFRKDFWTGFYRHYPGTAGLLCLSRPGYSANKEVAVTYFNHETSGKTGISRLLYLRKQHGKWRIVRTLSMSVA